VERVGATNSLGLMARFGEHEQVQLERETLNQCTPDERRVLDEQQGNHLESVSVRERPF
jgi:hypothetical protein